MAVTSANVLLIAPELSEITEQQWTLILSWVNAELNVKAWGSQARADRAGTYLAAHLATAIGAESAEEAGPLQSISVGGVSKTYANLSSSADAGDYSSTAYGQEYARLLRAIPRILML